MPGEKTNASLMLVVALQVFSDLWSASFQWVNRAGNDLHNHSDGNTKYTNTNKNTKYTNTENTNEKYTDFRENIPNG